MSALAGVLMAVATPPLSEYPLAWISLIPLWWTIDTIGSGETSCNSSAARSSAQISPAQISSAQISPAQLSPAQLSPAQISSAQLSSAQISPAQLSSAQQSLPTNRSLCGDVLQTAGMSLAWGVGYYGITLNWITGLHPLTWLGISWAGSVAIALTSWGAVILWETLPIVLWAIGLGLLKRRFAFNRWVQLTLGTALWCSLDWIWSYSPLYAGSLALTQSPHNVWLLHLGRWVGSLGITAAIVLVNGLFTYAIRSFLSRHRSHHRGHYRSDRVWLTWAVSLLVLVHGCGFWILQQSTSDRLEQSVTIGLIQGNIPTQIKLTSIGLQQSLQTYTQGYEALADLSVDVVFMPEGAIPLEWDSPYRERTALYQAIRRHQIPAWVSTFLTAQDGSDRYSQSLIALQGSGAVTSRYDKVKLVPLGEYIPLEKVLSKLLRRLSLMEGSLAPGTGEQTFLTNWGQAAIAICYEPTFNYIIQKQVQSGAEFILNPSNLDPYDTRLMAYQEALNVMRAIENDRWLAAVSNTGYSSLISPQGQVQWRSSPWQLVIQPVTLYRRQTQTLFTQGGNRIALLLLWGLFLLGAFHEKRKINGRVPHGAPHTALS